MSMRLLTELGLGRIWYAAWHKPRTLLHDIERQGGFGAWRAMRLGQARLNAAASHFTGIQGEELNGITLNLLTGTRYWDQSVACIHTLQRHAGLNVHVRFLDDGTLTGNQAETLARLSPFASIQGEKESRARMLKLLPAERYPALHALWSRYKHIRKLTDAHLGREGVNLVLDSDMLFHALPGELLEWCRSPETAVAMRDCEESYGYPRERMSELAGAAIPDRINVGIVGLRSDSVDWSSVEIWASTLIREFGSHYFLEQALSAMLLAQMPHRILDAARYRVIANHRPDAESEAALVHYVAGAKRQYFDRDWRALLT